MSVRFPRMDDDSEGIFDGMRSQWKIFSHVVNELVRIRPEGLRRGHTGGAIVSIHCIKVFPPHARIYSAIDSAKKMLQTEIVENDNSAVQPADFPNPSMKNRLVANVVNVCIGPVYRGPGNLMVVLHLGVTLQGTIPFWLMS